jgi:hypothetical protein
MRMHLVALAVAALLTTASAAQQHKDMPGMTMPGMSGKSMPGMDMHETGSNTPYRPGLGDLMTAFVQPRHIKLGLAGTAQNWDYAAYELGELREAFDDVAKLVVKHGNLQIAPAIASTVKLPMDALDAAIRAKDQTAFARAYSDLTDGCNACHKSADHAMIVIKVPEIGDAAFPDQDFGSKK